MSEVKGMLKTYDRCGESIFLKTIGDRETDGGFTRWNKFEDAPEGWVYHSEPGTYAVTLCPMWYKNLAEARARCEKSGKCDDYLTVEVAEEMSNRFNEIPN